jgi:hypothetical protein
LTFESYAAFIFVSDDCHAGRLNSSARDRGVLNSSELLALQDIHEMVRPALWGSAFSFLGRLDMPSALRGLRTHRVPSLGMVSTWPGLLLFARADIGD